MTMAKIPIYYSPWRPPCPKIRFIRVLFSYFLESSPQPDLCVQLTTPAAHWCSMRILRKIRLPWRLWMFKSGDCENTSPQKRPFWPRLGIFLTIQKMTSVCYKTVHIRHQLTLYAQKKLCYEFPGINYRVCPMMSGKTLSYRYDGRLNEITSVTTKNYQQEGL